MGDVLRVGMIGAGGIAQSHMGAIAGIENVSVEAVMDIDAGRAEAAAAEHGARACTTIEAVLEDDAIQAVHVCTVHNVHCEQTVAAAEAGKHVLVEKPMALSVAECDRMIAACEASGVVLQVGQVMRYYPVHLRVRQMIRDGELGAVGTMIRRRYSKFDPRENRPWYLDLEVGGIAVLYCFGPHEYDILPWLVDAPVETVYSQGTSSTPLYEGQNDSYATTMTHTNGTVSVLTQTVVSHQGAHDTFIMGGKGSVFLTNRSLSVNGEEVPLPENSNREGMPAQIREFAACCLEGGTPDASGRSVRHTMAVIEAAKVSAERNEPVSVAEMFGA